MSWEFELERRLECGLGACASAAAISKTSVRMAIRNGNPSAGRLMTEKAPPLSPIPQEMRLVTKVSPVRSHELHCPTIRYTGQEDPDAATPPNQPVDDPE
jgi:hypothetical protein